MSNTMTPSDEPAPADATCDYVVVSVNTDSQVAQVKFLNPYYSGKYVEEAQAPSDATKSEGASEQSYATQLVDKDPNPHMTKSVNIPFNESGPDFGAFAEICSQQARSARNRMEAAYVRNIASTTKSVDLSALVGLTNKSASSAA